jgi:hypothetical protein
MFHPLRSLPAAFLLLFGLASGLQAVPDDTQPKIPDEDLPPPITSPYLNWQFDAPKAKTWEALQALIKEDGLTIKEKNDTAGSFVTELLEFDEKKFTVDVSIPPPRANPKYPWLQPIVMTSGRYGLDGKLSSLGPNKTRLDLKAILEIAAINSKVGGKHWVPRYSNGAIEHQYFSRLSFRLLAEASGQPSSK